MIKASYKQIRRPHWPRSLTAVITAAALLVSLLVEYSAACNVTDVDIYAGKNQQEANNKTHSPDSPIYICTGSTAYFYAVCIAESDSVQKRRLKWTYTFGDGGSTTHYTAWNVYTDIANHQYNSTEAYTVNLTVEREGLSGSSFSNTCKVTSFEVLINDPANFPAYVALDDTLQLGSTVIPVGGGTYSWSKVTGPGTVTFSPSSSAEDPSFSADQAGDYTVQVQYTKSWATGQTTCSATSGTIHVIDGLTVFPREAYVCVGCTKDFQAWKCVDSVAENVTAQSTFSAPTDRGSFPLPPPNHNTYYAPSTPSTSEGSDWVKASYGGSPPTDDDHDCELTVVSVDITDDAGNPITTTQTVCVGQKISLKTKILPSGLTGSNWQWTIPPIVVKDYKKETIAPGRTKAYVVELTDTDKQQSTIQFYWVDGADGRDISVSCQINGEVSCADTVQFNVKRPAVGEFGLATGDVVVGDSWGSTQLSFGIPTLPGVAYGWRVTPPSAFGGKLKIVQLVEAHFEKIYIDDDVENQENSDFWLDSEDPYADPKDAPAGVQTEIVESDSPALILLVGFKEVEVIYAFYHTYLMFEPTGSESIWVPLSKFEWNWDGRATSSDGGNSWVKSSGTGAADSASGTTEFPEWPDTFTPTHPPWE